MTKHEPELMTTANISAAETGPFLVAPGRTRQWMNWLFVDKARMFWVLQIAGWLGFFMLHVLSVSTFVAGRSSDALLYSVASSLIGFLTTSILARPIYRFARRQGPVLLLGIALPSTILMAFVGDESANLRHLIRQCMDGTARRSHWHIQFPVIANPRCSREPVLARLMGGILFRHQLLSQFKK
ncbi:MAG: hypothetical protein GXP06_03605 [Alphaproteobacteria bacterium]|nr:hypothetical protein [Alphaproteobacteria bacterium]